MSRRRSRGRPRSRRAASLAIRAVAARSPRELRAPRAVHGHHLWRRVLLAAILAAAALGRAPVHAGAAGTSGAAASNPDPARIAGARGASTLRVTPRGDARDYDNLQWAADNVAPGGTLELEAGTFFLGDGEAAPKRTVLLRQGVRLLGRRDGESWLTVVRGGGEGDCGPSQIESGPFLVRNDADDEPTILEDLWLREWTAEAVCIEKVRGFVFRRNRLSHPVNTTKEGAIRFVHALWSTGIEARGDFVAEGNLVELGGYDGALAEDEQFLGVFFSNHDDVRVVDNTIVGIDEAIEIIGNRVDRTARGEGPPARGEAEVVVTRNRIDVTQQPGERWPSTFAILVAGNRGARRVSIEENQLTVRGKGYAFGLSGERLSVARNTVRFEPFAGSFPAGVATIGFGTLAGMPMGSSLVDSTFEDNAFEGAVREVGIAFRPGREGELNSSHGNRFALGDSLARLGAGKTLVLPPTVHDNVFTGEVGVVADESPPGANRYR